MFDARAFDRLRQAVGDDPADLAEIAGSFLEEAPALIDAMVKAAAAGDLDAVHRQAHSLKSNARDFGATSLAELCQALEHELRSGKPPANLEERVASISGAWDGVRPLLMAEIARLGAG